MIAELVFNVPVERGFHYEVPAGWRVELGMRALAPFGPRTLVGFITQLPRRSQVKQPKMLLRLLDEAPVLSAESLRVARWLAHTYICSLGEACAAMVPTALRVRPGSPRAESLAVGSGFDPERQRRAEHGTRCEAGPPSLLTLTPAQQCAYEALHTALNARRAHTFLIHGVTGSGKTELYLRLIAEALSQGRSAICLVPEIALTPQTIDRFQQRFGSAVALWHSRLTARQRGQEWSRMRTGQARVVVGTRSAVFAPIASIGAIILDEEQDASYKQEEVPRYHARDVALERARLAKAVVILGSATPSVESYFHAHASRYTLLELPTRIHERPMPQVDIVDMRQDAVRVARGSALSPRLQQALTQVVDRHEQAILLLNRRGFARSMACPACGIVMRCRDCAVPLIYHASRKGLLCHYCNAQQEAPESCPACRRGVLRVRGVGTERIESELYRLFPTVGIGRMDRDTTRGRTSHREIYDAMHTQAIDLLVGTQMVAKGWDIPQVTLVGVVSADTALNIPDFRAGELTFALLTQVAGRAGRGERPGRVIIQTACPTHYAIVAASRHDAAGFYKAELAMRRRLALPPFVRLIELTVHNRRRPAVQAAAETLAEALKAARVRSVTILGPAPHRVAVLRGRHRWRVLLKTRSIEPALALVRQTIGSGRRIHGLPVSVDVDPR